MGRPSDYRPEYDEQAYKLCLLGATDGVIADFFDVSEQTVNSWKKQFPSFLESLKKGKIQADAEIAASVFKRGTGYDREAVKIFQYEGQPVVVPYVEHYPSDTGAAALWLKNRQPKLWRDKQEKVIDVTNHNPRIVLESGETPDGAVIVEESDD